MAQRNYVLEDATVVRSGKTHKADDLPRDAKEVVFTFKAYEEVDGADDRYLGMFGAPGSIESGNITWVQHDDIARQLEASNPKGREVTIEQEAPEEIVPVVEEKK